MGVYLSGQPNDAASHVDLGEIDPLLTANRTIHWESVISSVQWLLPLSHVNIENETVGILATTAIVDTGSSYISIPAGMHPDREWE